jgi:hypothetical protein
MNSIDWLAHFQRNATNNLDLTDRDPHLLTAEERAKVTSSIQTFQIGEASEGRTLQRFAETFAKQEGDVAYAEAVKFFIREENRHSGYLRTFMQEHAIPRARKQWSDSVFRHLRKLAGLELSIRVLVTAEMIAAVYYPALGAATGSRKLARICERMCEEEATHVRFQMGAVARLKARRSTFMAKVADWGHGFLMAGTTLVVWWDHRAVLKAKHAGYGDFFRACWQVYTQALKNSELTRPAPIQSPVASRRVI